MQAPNSATVVLERGEVMKGRKLKGVKNTGLEIDLSAHWWVWGHTTFLSSLRQPDRTSLN